MKPSLRVRRMARNHKKLLQQPKLNLVALMDIFTILVFFLMVNNGDVEILQSDKNVPLPDSISEQRPEMALLLKVSATDIIVQGRTVENIDTALSQPGNGITKLGTELQYQAARAAALTQQEKESGRSIIIMGSQDMTYTLLKRIMTTCAANDYRNISLAVNSAPPADGAQTQVAQR
jgi:biopolymer transport protein ExbD